VHASRCSRAREIIAIAVNGARLLQEGAARHPNVDWTFEYSPESFSGTEPDFAVDVCNAVIDVWQPQRGQKVVVNLPATVEMTTSNVFADQVEHFCRHVAQRKHIRVSLHTHNDRGCAVAAGELGLLAGADRIEGTLFGNGERTGNMDIVTMAMNLYCRASIPLDFRGDRPHHRRLSRHGHARCTRAIRGRRSRLAAFSASRTRSASMAFHREQALPHWAVAYLPIDPRDLGRKYEEVVRINSQSGKGGVALVLERDHGLALPKWLHPAVSRVVQAQADATGEEVSSRQIRALFEKEFLGVPDGWRLQGYDLHSESQRTHGKFRLAATGTEVVLTGEAGAHRGPHRRREPALRVSVDIIDRGRDVVGRKRSARVRDRGSERAAASACCIDESSLASLRRHCRRSAAHSRRMPCARRSSGLRPSARRGSA
jgi:2-isopropylmalate synthase